MDEEGKREGCGELNGGREDREQREEAKREGRQKDGMKN